MQIFYPYRAEFERMIRERPDHSLEFILLITGAMPLAKLDGLEPYLDECIRTLKPKGLLFVQGLPEYLPEVGVYLDQHLNFKYWIAIESTLQRKATGLPTEHAGILLFSKGNSHFNIKRTRFPHQYCSFCKDPLKDWGGKKHLMHPQGVAVSDVWTTLPSANNYTRLSGPALNTILDMLDFESSEITGLIGPAEGLEPQRTIAESVTQYTLPGLAEIAGTYDPTPTPTDARMIDTIHQGDALQILKQYPDNSVDVVFADPPYNLAKAYHIYQDEREDYVTWCNAWLEEYVRILKPTGSLYVLNLPRWTMYHANFLNRRLYFQNWIVWDALSEPRGKLMPAHYGLLFYTKHPTAFTFNYDTVASMDARYYCLRSSCIRQRKSRHIDDKEFLTDFWWNIHRIKHRRDRDYHPCQLPETLMERIIRLSTNPGDIVLDAFAGTGTTAVTAAKLGRHYVAIDLDGKYVAITQRKIAEIERRGFIKRKSIAKPRPRLTKKELQLELRTLAVQLGRLPTQEDVRRLSKYDLKLYRKMFPTWGKALKAAKLEVAV